MPKPSDESCAICQYSLRGLLEDVVTCPECGQTIDMHLLRQAKEDMRWFKVPRTEEVQGPGCALLGLMVLPIVAYYAIGVWPAAGLAGLCAVAWAVMTHHAVRMFKGHGGLWVSLVGQMSMAVAMLGLVVILASVICLAFMFINPSFQILYLGTGLLLVGYLLCNLGVLGYRIVARRCLRLYIADESSHRHTAD